MKRLLLSAAAVLMCAAAFAAASFGKLADGREATIWRYASPNGLIMDFTDFGGRVVRCYAPDRYGNLADVTLGWNTPHEYETQGFSMSCLIGRFGNRIRDGKFKLDGKEYRLSVNETKPAPRNCCIHGGARGWDSKLWTAKPLEDGIEFSIVSPDGDMGFPGTVRAKVTYRVLPGNIWSIDYEATTDKPTIVNLTQHGYWNLAGEAAGTLLDQEVKIFADRYTHTDAGLIPVEVRPVKGTGFDFTEFRKLGHYMDWLAAQPELACTDFYYDHNFCLRGETGKLHEAVFMRDPVSGRTMEIWTTEPGLQIYGSQNMDGTLAAKTAGKFYQKFAGLVFETQHWPDSPNHPDYPSTVLRPGEVFRSHSEYRFGVMK